MPNGHGGIPRFGMPILIGLILVIGILVRTIMGYRLFRYDIHLLAILFGWRLAYHIHLWNVTEYGGAMTSENEMIRARKRYLIGAIVYSLIAVAALFIFSV